MVAHDAIRQTFHAIITAPNALPVHATLTSTSNFPVDIINQTKDHAIWTSSEKDAWDKTIAIAAGLSTILSLVISGLTWWLAYSTKNLFDQTRRMADKTAELAEDTKKATQQAFEMEQRSISRQTSSETKQRDEEKSSVYQAIRSALHFHILCMQNLFTSTREEPNINHQVWLLRAGNYIRECIATSNDFLAIARETAARLSLGNDHHQILYGFGAGCRSTFALLNLGLVESERRFTTPQDPTSHRADLQLGERNGFRSEIDRAYEGLVQLLGSIVKEMGDDESKKLLVSLQSHFPPSSESRQPQ